MVPSDKIGELTSLLQAAFTTTVSLCESCERGDLGRTAELLKEREDLLRRAMEVRQSIPPGPGGDSRKEDLQGCARRLGEALQKENRRFVTILEQKRKQTVEELRKIRNHKSILAYTE